MFDNIVGHKIIDLLGKGCPRGQKEGKSFVVYNHISSGMITIAFTCFCQVWHGSVELLGTIVKYTLGNGST